MSASHGTLDLIDAISGKQAWKKDKSFRIEDIDNMASQGHEGIVVM